MSNVIINPYTFAAPQQIIEFDMSDDSSWTFVGSTCGINEPGEYLFGDSTVNDDRGTSEIQTDFTLSDTLWIIRQKFDIVTYTSPASNNNGQLYYGFSDNTAGVLGTRDGIGIMVTCGSGAAIKQSYANAGGWTGFNMTTAPSVTTYYAELKRNSATSITLTLYSDSGYSSVVETKTSTISADITDLKYIFIGAFDHSAIRVVGVRVSDLIIYNNYSSVP